ncbi:hypothetical protein P8452_64682 [Trifolium repens]|jgi:hypothetical protein|nr:hypothetical protein QL285_086005 [Trifolium repens]WJX81850.1 hypothetical protein P8452_64682 [Trifolium repens]
MNCKSLVELHFENLWIEKRVDRDSLPSLNKLFLNNVGFYTNFVLVSIINISHALEQLNLIKPYVISSACDVEMSDLMELKQVVLKLPWKLLMILHFLELRAMEIHVDDDRQGLVK